MKIGKVCAAVLGVLALSASPAIAQTGFAGGDPWQTGDIVACFGTVSGFGGACNTLRIVNGTAVLLDQFSDTLQGSTFGVAINNTLHVVATDDASPGNVVVYSVPSLNGNVSPPTATPHIRVYTYPTNGGGSNPRAVAIDNAGNIFVLDNTSSPGMVKLGPGPGFNQLATISLSGCLGSQGTAITEATSMDLSAFADANGNSLYAYVTSGGTIQQVTLSGAGVGTCAKFADFGTGVTLYGIKDIPPNALSGINCKGGGCPTHESILVVATGFTDPALEAGEPSPNDPDAVNVCTNATDGNPVSCALLLDTNPTPGSLWAASTQYFTLGAPILDPKLELQTVNIAGKSGSDEPAFSETGGKVIDNAVIWTNQGQPPWVANHAYSVVAPPLPTSGTYIVDSNFNLETVTTAGISGPGPNQPAWVAKTVDGLQWNDLGQLTRVSSSLNPVGSLVSDPLTHAQQVIQAGKSGSGALPAVGWNDLGGHTIEGVTWTESNPTWMRKTQFPVGTLIIDNQLHVQQVQQAGTSIDSNTAPNFNEGSTTNDNTVTWVDLGQAVWRPSFGYGLNAIILDSGGHVQQVTTAGTSGGGPNPPNFPDDGSSTTPDGSVVWTDRGVLSGNATFTWQPSTAYAVNAEIIDNNQHVELVTVAGTSGYGIAAPAFVDGGTVPDNSVTWADLGQAVWRANFSYGLNAIIVDAGNHVQQVTTGGTSGPGPNPPAFPDDGSSTTPDGTVTWTDRGLLAGGPFTWQASTTYNLNAMIVDSNNHVELATTNPQGQSGAGPNPPAFADGGSVIDGLIWADQGTPSWIANHPYSIAGNVPVPLPGSYIVDSNNHLETVTVPGISGPGPSAPQWPNAGMTIDGLIWADVGAWQKNTQYFTLFQANVFALGTAVGDSSFHVHTVVATGTSGSGPSTPAGGWNDINSMNNGLTLAGITIDNAVVWTESHPMWQMNHTYTVGNSDTLILDSNKNVELATNNDPQSVGTSAVSGPNQPSVAGHNPWNATTTGKTIDGLQWLNSSTTSSVVARYPVNGTTMLQSLALDPLIVDCSGPAGCSYPYALPGPVLKVTSVVSSPGVGNPTLSSPGFWLGDIGSQNFFKLDFATGTATMFNANGNAPWRPNTPYLLNAEILDPAQHVQKVTTAGTSGSTQPTFNDFNGTTTDNTVQWTDQGPVGIVSSIQGLGIYGSEGANQPGLAKLLFSNSSTALNNQTGIFPSSTANATFAKNSLELTLYNGTSPAGAMGQFAMYASPVALNSCFDDSTGNPPCLATFQPGGINTPAFPIMWKNDVPLPSSGKLALDQSTQALTGNFDFPTSFQSFLNDVTLDSQFDVTTSNGLDKPSYVGPSTGHGRRKKQVSGSEQAQNYGCLYNSPVISPSHSCFANPGTIPIKFSCSNLQGNPLQNYGMSNDGTTPWGPNIVVKEFGNQPIPLPKTPPFNPPPPNPVCTGIASTGGAPSKVNAGKIRGADSTKLQGCDGVQLPSANGTTTATFKSNMWTYNWGPIQSTPGGVIYEICTEDDSDGSWSNTGNAGQEFCSLPFYVKNTCP